MAVSTTLQTPSSIEAIETTLARLWEQMLGVECISRDDNFFDLGGESSLAVRMFAEIEKTFRTRLPLAILYEAPTVAQLACALKSGSADSTRTCLVAIQPQGTKPPLFCFHGAGGNVLMYRELSVRLGLDQPVYGLQSRGLDGNLPPLTRVEDMASLYLKEIRQVQSGGPYLLAGYCGGGTIAYEVAQQLRSSGEHVALLALFDTMNWSKIPITLQSKVAYGCQRLLFHAATLLSLNLRDLLTYLRRKLEVARNRMPVWRGMLLSMFSKNHTAAGSATRLLGHIWRTNDIACWQYRPTPYAGRITDFRPARQYRIFDKPELKWAELAQEGQDVFVLPVYPASMLLEPFVGGLANALAGAIDQALSDSPRRILQPVACSVPKSSDDSLEPLIAAPSA